MNSKSKKIVIGFAGDKEVGKTTAANIFEKNGFYKTNINSKVREFASHLFSKNELHNNEDKILSEVRKRGLNVHKGYWFNLVLISIPNDKNNIVFDDIEMNELIDKIKIYIIYRPGFSKELVHGKNVIINDGTKEEFVVKIKDLCEEIICTKKV